MNRPSIFLVEDNPDDEDLTRMALLQTGIEHTLVVARDGAEALEYLIGPAGDAFVPPTVILMDLKLPKVDGLEVLRRIRQEPRTRLIPVVVLSTSGEEKDIVTSYLHGANGYVRKPVAFDRFAEVMRQVGQFWLGVNETPGGNHA